MQEEKRTRTHLPTCVGIIMDGNRRWARETGRSSLEGHSCGYSKVKEVVEWMKEAEVPNLIVYAFSTENWNRQEAEVSYLMNLFRKVLTEEADELSNRGVRILCAGERARLPVDIQNMVRDVEEKTKNNTPFTLVIAISYGGRSEILNAVNILLEKGEGPINEETFSNALWTRDVPDPDIIIRTGGERRLSGFLPWQSVYSELFFVDTYWPAFSKQEFFTILEEFAGRERRRGR